MASLASCARHMYTTNKFLSSVVLRRSLSCSSVCQYKKHLKKMYKDLYTRRIEQGPEPATHRSEYANWNHCSELYACGKRLGEEFSEATLRTAFTHRSYLESEKQRWQAMGLENEQATLGLQDNSELALTGEQLASEYIHAYLCHHYPRLPEEAISAVVDLLLSHTLLSQVAANLGLSDLILSKEFPVSNETLSQTLKALIGGLATDQGMERGQLLVQDLIITQLVGCRLMDIWSPPNPMALLDQVLHQAGQPAPEPRLLFETGASTVLAAYMAGIYTNHTLIGTGYGETVSMAEEMAARDALARMFGVSDRCCVLRLGKAGRTLALDLHTTKPTHQLNSIQYSLNP